MGTSIYSFYITPGCTKHCFHCLFHNTYPGIAVEIASALQLFALAHFKTELIDVFLYKICT